MRIKKKEPTLRRLPGEPSARTLRLIRTAAHLSLTGMLSMWVILYFWKEEPYAQVWQVFVAHLAGGRAGGVGTGFLYGFSPKYLFVQSFLTDLILILYVYSLFVSGFQRAARWPLIGSWLTKMHEAALKHKDRIAPYGPPGLMIFVIIPIWTTGPIVGVLAGYMLGMRTWVTFFAVLFGDFIAVGTWIMLYDQVSADSNTKAAALLILVFTLVLFGALFSYIVRRKNRRKNDIKSLDEESDIETPHDAAMDIELTKDADASEKSTSSEASPQEVKENKDDDFLELL